MNRDTLLPHVEAIVEALRPACEDIAIAGGLRRGKADPHDAEIVCLPKRDADLFGGAAGHSVFDVALADLTCQAVLDYDQHVKRNGERYKRFLIRAANFPLDLFIADAENFGAILAIRTGDADWSRLMMTQRHYGGLMPQGLKQYGGYLLRDSGFAEKYHSRPRVSCRTEADFFAALGIPWVEPANRNEATASRIAKELPR